MSHEWRKNHRAITVWLTNEEYARYSRVCQRQGKTKTGVTKDLVMTEIADWELDEGDNDGHRSV